MDKIFISFYYRIRITLLLLIAAWFLASCTTAKQPLTALSADPDPVPKNLLASPLFKTGFSGLLLLDPEKNDTIFQHLADHYFVPASNTKLLTLYIAQKILGDSVPGLKYEIKNDSLIFWGTGDPSFLHPTLKGTRVYNFLKARKEKLFYADAPYKTSFFGVGWAWDDYNSYYSPERSPMPIYGNVVRFSIGKAGKHIIAPKYFKPAVKISAVSPVGNTDPVVREIDKNIFNFYPAKQKLNSVTEVPFRQSAALQVALLRDTLKKEVKYLPRWPKQNTQIIYSFSTDSICKVMMQASDNMLAEQLLTLCAATVSDTLDTERLIKYAIKNYLQDLPDKPVWVDGSGLSRQNLLTPRSMVYLLQKLNTEIPRERLFPMLAIGGLTGTLRNSYKAETPFLYGKTGSMSNVYALSGYLLTKSGRTLIFSFMNNNFVTPSAAMRQEIERILTEVHLTY